MGSFQEEMDVEMKNPGVFGLYYSEHPYVIGLLDYINIGLV
jgi:tRNA nucleotidyltransferase (CCA-adding enzyme)